MPTPVPIFWHQLTSLRAGLGKLRLVLLRTQEEAAALPQDLRISILGNGTNVIGCDSDMPADEVAVKLAPLPDACCSIEDTPSVVRLPAALPLTVALRQCARMGMGGLAALSGIPGTVGGALAMNAGALGYAVGDCVLEMGGWDFGRRQPWRWRRGEDGTAFGYRRSPVPPNVLLFHCALQLQPVDSQDELARIEDELQRRRKANPQGHSAGSVFRNPGEGFPAAGKLLEDSGCKGLSQGALLVSAQHANWIMNPSGAPAGAADAAMLVNIMRQRVQERFGITLHTEWRWMDHRHEITGNRLNGSGHDGDFR